MVSHLMPRSDSSACSAAPSARTRSSDSRLPRGAAQQQPMPGATRRSSTSSSDRSHPPCAVGPRAARPPDRSTARRTRSRGTRYAVALPSIIFIPRSTACARPAPAARAGSTGIDHRERPVARCAPPATAPRCRRIARGRRSRSARRRRSDVDSAAAMNGTARPCSVEAPAERARSPPSARSAIRRARRSGARASAGSSPTPTSATARRRRSPPSSAPAPTDPRRWC